MSTRATLLFVLLTGCGHTSHNASDPPGATAGAPAASAGSPSATGMAGAAGSDETPMPSADIAGRWGMFTFGDPVGVELVQNGNQLTGRGCASAAPPLADGDLGVCGDIHGDVEGDQAKFRFSFMLGGNNVYDANVTVSADRQRMTGAFHAVVELDYPTAWLRVPDGERWLVATPTVDNEAMGSFRLTLAEADGDAAEYEPAREYRLAYFGMGIASDLGSFWLSEIGALDARGTVEVGPVAVTQPGLAVAMKLSVDSELGITQVQAITGSGHRYVFAAVRIDPEW